MSWHRTARGGMYALGVFVLSIVGVHELRALGIGPFGILVASGKLKSKEPLLITDFHVTNADTSLGRVVSDAVRAGLSQSSVLSLMSTGGDRAGASADGEAAALTSGPHARARRSRSARARRRSSTATSRAWGAATSSFFGS